MVKKREELERWKNGLGTTNEEGGRNMGERGRTWRRKGAGGSEQKERREKRGQGREGRRKEGPGGGWSVEETAEGESFVLEN